MDEEKIKESSGQGGYISASSSLSASPIPNVSATNASQKKASEEEKATPKRG
jgi:hypothetical protein